MRAFRFAILPALLAAATAGRADAAESFDNCAGFITSLPAVISSQGVWCMDRDLATASASGNAIDVTTNNVTLDCNGYKLGNLAAGTGTQAAGVYADTRRNITVRGCNIRGFRFGVRFEGPGAGHLVEDNRIEGSTLAGLYLDGDNLIIRRNQVIDSGGTTVTANAYGYGIAVSGRVLIDDNLVSGVIGSGTYEAVGIAALDSSGSVIRDNVVVGVRNVLATINYGVIVYSAGASVHGNTVLGDGSTSAGIVCAANPIGVHDNSIGGFTTALSGACVDADNRTF